MFFACVVDYKGFDSTTIQAAVQFIQACGLTEFVYRADRERSISKLLSEVIDLLATRNVKGHALEASDPEDAEGDPVEHDEEEASDLKHSDLVLVHPDKSTVAVPERTRPGEAQSTGSQEALECCLQSRHRQARSRVLGEGGPQQGLALSQLGEACIGTPG